MNVKKFIFSGAPMFKELKKVETTSRGQFKPKLTKIFLLQFVKIHILWYGRGAEKLNYKN